MGLSSATLNGRRATSARTNVPGWGCWYADATVDAEVEISGAVTLQIADLSLKGTIIAGGPAKGRSDFRIVAGAGKWGNMIPRKPYANDAGVKRSRVIADAAAECGETFDAGDDTVKVGPAFVRKEGPACRVLEQLAPGAWYIDNDGVTRLGKRPAGKPGAGVTHGPVDRARGTVTLASESITSIMPGLVVDGLEVVDVLHEINAKTGLRSTVWGRRGTGLSRMLEAWRNIARQEDPDRAFRGVTEYRVVSLEGERLNLQPVRVSTGMPDLLRVSVRPGVAGVRSDAALGARVLVGFVDSDPARPAVLAFEDADGEGFLPVHLDLAGGTEHLMTTEAAVLLIYNTLALLMVAAGGGPLIAAVLQPLIVPAITAAIAAQSIPATPTEAAQIIANAALIGTMVPGTAPSNGVGAFGALIDAAIAAKVVADESGLFPGLGSRRARTA